MTARTSPGATHGPAQVSVARKGAPGPAGPAGRGDRAHRRIAVVRALPGVGDLLCTLPALRALRACHPGARVTLVGLPTAGWFVARYHDLVDDLLVVDGVPGLPEVDADPSAALRFYAAAHARRFDLAVQLHGDGRASNPLTTMLGARHQVTAYVPGMWQPPGTGIPYPAEGPEIHRLLAVVAAAGCPPVDDAVDMPLDPAEVAAARALTRPAEVAAARATAGGAASGNGAASADSPTGDGGAARGNGVSGVAPYVCLHPGASRTGNRWPAAGFAAVGDRLAAAGFRAVLTGTIGERDVVAAVAQAMSAPVVDLCGCTSVGTLAAVFAGSRLVVSNDTGAAHVAAAVRARSVVVFPAHGDPDRWAPLDRDRHVVVAPVPGASRAPNDPWPATGAVVAAAVDTVDVPAPPAPASQVLRRRYPAPAGPVEHPVARRSAGPVAGQEG